MNALTFTAFLGEEFTLGVLGLSADERWRKHCHFWPTLHWTLGALRRWEKPEKTRVLATLHWDSRRMGDGASIATFGFQVWLTLAE